MILRLEKYGIEMPPPTDPDPQAATTVQELMGGRFGELSTLMNYTFQSFNFREKASAKPFYDLIANIAAEEYGHIELVAATINSLNTGATPNTGPQPPSTPLEAIKDLRNTQTWIAGGGGAAPQDSRAMPWNGDNVFSSGDLAMDLLHNFFLESGARQQKLRVYEMSDHPAVRALAGYLLVRGGVHQVAYARALEKLHPGANLSKLFPLPHISTDSIPESKAYIEKGMHTKLYRFSLEDYRDAGLVFNGPHPETGEDLEYVDGIPDGAAPPDLPANRDTGAPGMDPEFLKEATDRLTKGT